MALYYPETMKVSAMSDSVRLSVFLTCHAQTPWFRPALDSILQSGYHFRRTEILVSDDVSPAGGDGDTAREYARRHPGLIRVIRHDGPSSGQAGAFTRLLPEMRGSHIMLFDSDDIFLPFDLDGSMDYLDAHPEAAAVYGKKRLFDAEHGDLGQSHGGDYSAFLALTLPTPVPNAAVIRARDLRETGGFAPPPGIGWDLFLWVRLGQRKVLVFDDNYRLLYRMHPGQMTKARQEQYEADYRFIADWVIERHRDFYDALTRQAAVAVPPERRYPFLMLCGYLVMKCELPPEHKLWILAAAEQVMPEDFSVYEYRGRLFLKHGSHTEALAEFFKMLLRFPQQPYVRLNAWRGIEAVCRQAGFPMGDFKAGLQQTIAEFFAMTPRQKERFDAAIADARRQAALPS